MKQVSLFMIYKKEVIWGTQSEENADITELGAFVKEDMAKEAVERANSAKKGLGVSFFYKEKKIQVFKDMDMFFIENFTRDLTLE